MVILLSFLTLISGTINQPEKSPGCENKFKFLQSCSQYSWEDLGEYTDLIPFSKLVPDNAESKGHFFFPILFLNFILFVVSLQQFVIRSFMPGGKKKKTSKRVRERETHISAKSLVLLAAKGWILSWCKLEIAVLKTFGLFWLTSWMSFLLPAGAKAEAAGKPNQPVLIRH